MKYNKEIASNILLKVGLIIDNCNYVNTTSDIFCHDEDNYKYRTCLSNILSGKKPLKYSISNPFTIENIQNTLSRETDGVQLLSTEYKNSKVKMMFLCSCGRKYEMNLNSFTSENKRYCNYCSKSKRYDGLIDYTKIIKEKCDINDYQLLTKEITRSTHKFKYLCNKHSENGFQYSTYDLFINQGSGCKYCGIENRGIKHRKPIEKVKKLLEMKGFVYVNHDYYRYSNGSKKIRIHCICKRHKDKGVQYLDYGNLKNNTKGCIYCIGQGRTQESLQKEFDELNANIKILEFNKYSDILVQCENCNNIWKTHGINIITGHRCPKCSKSRYERIVENILIENKIEYIPQYRTEKCKDILPLPFDFYIPSKNIFIEVDGEAHFYPVNFGGISNELAQENFVTIQKHDEIKDKFCKNNNYKLLRIPYYIFQKQNINSYLLNNI